MSTFSEGRFSTPQRLGLWALLTAMIAFAVPTEALAEAKFAVIDLRRAVADTEDGLRVQAKLQQLFDNRQSEYETREKNYKKLKLELEKLAKEGKTPQATLRKKYEALEKFALELQRASGAYRREKTR
jgi:outer membrane protein